MSAAAVPAPAAGHTVEAVVRAQLAKALGGRRGMFEAAVPTLLFTITWLTTKEMTPALSVSVASAAVLLVIRLVQRSSVQFVVNALVGIGIGWFFANRSAAGGGDANDQALAYFLPGILYNGGYTVVLAVSCLVGWPVIGFMVGSVTGDPTAWHRDKAIVRLCTRLTWFLALPCLVRVVAQAPVWWAGKNGHLDPDAAVAALGVMKIAMGWPLQLAALAGMVWLLARNSTPVSAEAAVRAQEALQGPDEDATTPENPAAPATATDPAHAPEPGDPATPGGTGHSGNSANAGTSHDRTEDPRP